VGSASPSTQAGAHAPAATPETPTKPKVPRWQLGLILGGVIVLLSGGLCSLLALLGSFSETKTLPSAEERALLTSIENVRPFIEGHTRGDGARQSYDKVVHAFGRGVELTYEYEWNHPETGIYIQSGASFFESERDARNTYIAMDVGLGIGLAVEGESVRQEEMTSSFTWGDQSKATRIVGPHGPSGTFFVGRKGTRVYYFVIGGVYFDSPQTLEALLSPQLAAFETFEPRTE
jgi:hypothetical protein